MIHTIHQKKYHSSFNRAIMAVVVTIASTTPSFAQNTKAASLQKCNTEVRINSIKKTSRADTLYVDFKLMQDGKKTFRQDIFKKDADSIFEMFEVGSQEKWQPKIDTLINLRNQKNKSLSDNLSILFLLDHGGSMPDKLIETIWLQMPNILNSLPETDKYIAIMENGSVSKTEKLDTGLWNNQHKDSYSSGRQSGETNLYKSVLSKLQELSGEQQTYYDSTSSNIFKDKNGDYMIFVFTNGHINKDDEYYELREDYFERENRVKRGETKNIPVHIFYLGDKNDLDEDTESNLKALRSIVGDDFDQNGKFYDNISSDTLTQVVMGTLDSLAADYRLILLNPEGKMYDGTPLSLQLYIKDNNGNRWASGEKTYAFGSPQLPIRVSKKDVSIWTIILIGLLLGLSLIGITYVIMQFLIPAIRYKHFLKKYVVPYSAAKSGFVEQKCYYCKEQFVDGDIVVTKCEHVVHKECWDENHNRCPEYGRHKCKTGIHYYNQNKKTDPKNATHFLPWILAGFVAGLLSWLCFRLLNTLNCFGTMMNYIASSLYPFNGEIDESILARAAVKTSQWLQAGISLGFFIVLAFSYVLEFRKIDGKVLGHLLLRALIGAIAGFVAFLLGGLIIIACGIENTCWYIDWIPWLLFALAVSVVLWYKTEIKLKSALTGGAISVLFSFIVMFVFTGTVTSMFSYMLYAAGLGVAIAVVHYASEKYFLRIDGCIKERDIAIYKWMSVTGGFNKVSIGKSPHCVLQMNWDPTEDICDRVVELYLENDRPYCKVLDNGATQQGRTLPKGTTLLLTHGSEFSIGKTRFTYIEKDA